MSWIKTIKIKPWSKDHGEFVLINEEDFDATRYELFSEDGADLGAIVLSDDDLRDAIKDLTGKVPHHKTGRAKLIEQYEAAKSALEG